MPTANLTFRNHWGSGGSTYLATGSPARAGRSTRDRRCTGGGLLPDPPALPYPVPRTGRRGHVLRPQRLPHHEPAPGGATEVRRRQPVWVLSTASTAPGARRPGR